MIVKIQNKSGINVVVPIEYTGADAVTALDEILGSGVVVVVSHEIILIE